MIRRRALAVAVLVAAPAAFAACSGGEVDAPAAVHAPSASAPASSSSPPLVVTPDGCVVGVSHAAVVSKLGFTREDPKAKGHAPGFNLDGRSTDGPDPMSCGKVDMIDPGGNHVDNQLAALIPAVEDIVGNAVDSLIQIAIDDGNLLIFLRMDGAQSLVDAPCLGFDVALGKVAKPSLGTNQEIEGYQTYDVDPAAVMSHGKGSIAGGVLGTTPFELAIPIKIFDVSFTLHIHGARFRATIDPDTGHMVGMLGGGVEIQEIIDGVAPGAGVYKILPMIKLILKTSADMAPDADGQCTQISSALTFEAVPAFLRAP